MEIKHYMEVGGREFEVVLKASITPFERGHGWGSHYGPTPDDMADVFIEEILLKGKKYDVELCPSHRFFDLIPDDAELFELIISQHGGYW